MSSGVGGGCRIFADIPVAVQPPGEQRIGGGELAQRRVVVARAVVVEAAAGVAPLPGVAVIGGQQPVGSVQMAGVSVAIAARWRAG